MNQDLSSLLLENKKLKEEIAELNLALAHAIWPRQDLVSELQTLFNTAPQNAQILSVLYQTKQPQSRRELELCLYHKDEEKEHSITFINVIVFRLRQRLGKDAIINTRNREGYSISAELRRRIKEHLDAQGIR